MSTGFLVPALPAGSKVEVYPNAIDGFQPDFANAKPIATTSTDDESRIKVPSELLPGGRYWLHKPATKNDPAVTVGFIAPVETQAPAGTSEAVAEEFRAQAEANRLMLKDAGYDVRKEQEDMAKDQPQSAAPGPQETTADQVDEGTPVTARPKPEEQTFDTIRETPEGVKAFTGGVRAAEPDSPNKTVGKNSAKQQDEAAKKASRKK